jgi:serine/threonine protein kinase
MPAAYGLLRCIGKSAVKHIVNLFTYGVGGDILVDAWEYWKKATREEKRAAEVQAVAQLAGAELRAEVARIVQEEAAALPPAQQAQVAAYLGQVPASIRRSLRRPSDPTGTTTAPGTVFRKPEDLLPLLPAALPRFKVGDRPLPGVDWELVELLGIGGFGEVWKARNPHFDGVAPVALKFCLDAAARERLLKHEAAVLNQVMRQGKHEGIVPLLHTYLSADPPCLAYEYIEGGDLAGLIQERATGLAPKQAAEVMKRVAEIVAFAHRLNPPIVHRDLKPANILVKRRPDGKFTLLVADFGIGGLSNWQLLQEEAGRQSIRSQNLPTAVRGAYTPLYASPQQIEGRPPEPRDDMHALGVIWYQLVTGDMKLLAIPTDWRDVVEERALGKDSVQLLASCIASRIEKRPADAGEMADRLAALLIPMSGRKGSETGQTDRQGSRAAGSREEPGRTSGHRRATKAASQDTDTSPSHPEDDSPVETITRFVAALTRRLQDSLGDGWEVWNSVEKEEIWSKPEYEVLSVEKVAWRKGERDLRQLRMALAYDKGMPGKVYFTVRAGGAYSYKPARPALGSTIVEPLDEKYGTGRPTGKWWPRWWVSPEDDYCDWSDPDVLLRLGRKETENNALQYFASRLAGMAKAVDAVVDR